MLIHFKGNKDELNKLGFYFSKKDNLIISIKYVLKNLENYSQTRDVVQKYYNWKITIDTTAEIYDKLLG